MIDMPVKLMLGRPAKSLGESLTLLKKYLDPT